MGLKTKLYGLLKKSRKMVNRRELRYRKDIKHDLLHSQERIASFQFPENHNPDKQYMLILSLSNLPFMIKVHSILGLLAKRSKIEPVLLTYSGCNWAKPYARIFGIHTIVYWDKLKKDIDAQKMEEVNMIVEDFMSSSPGVQEIKNWTFNNVYCGKHALSSMIRQKLTGQVDLNDATTKEELKTYLSKAIMAVFTAEELFQKYDFSLVIVRDAGYLPNGAIFEVALNKNIDAIRFEMAQMKGHWQAKRYSLQSRGQALFSISPQTWDKYKQTSLIRQQNAELERDFQERYHPDSKKDIYKYQKGKINVPSNEVYDALNLDRNKPIAVIFSHISWDANFFDGEDLFENFEHWLVETTRIAMKNPNLNWVVKLHPANVYKLKRAHQSEVEIVETEMEALKFLGPLPDHIKIMRSSNPINTWSLFELIDYGLTVRGTIGAELPCYGIPVVTAGTGRYDHYGFTIDPATREEYEKILLELHQYPRLDPIEIDRARRHAYMFFLNRTISFDNISEMTSTVSEDPNHPLHHNIELKKDLTHKIDESDQISKFESWLFNSNEPDFIYSNEH